MEPASVTVNGRHHPWRPELTLAALLEEIGARGGGMAVEHNLRVVSRDEYASTRLQAGDQIEIVRLVGGG